MDGASFFTRARRSFSPDGRDLRARPAALKDRAGGDAAVEKSERSKIRGGDVGMPGDAIGTFMGVLGGF